MKEQDGTLRVFNTLTRAKEVFAPSSPPGKKYFVSGDNFRPPPTH